MKETIKTAAQILIFATIFAVMAYGIVFGAYTRDWTESTPTDATVANQIDEYNRYLRIDVSERLESMFYGMHASTYTGAEAEYGVKHLKMYPQTTPTTDADYGFIYAKTASSLEELHYKDGSASQTETQITSAGYINGAALKPDSVDSAHYAADSIDAEHLADDFTFDTFPLSPSAAPDADYELANKKYVDDNIPVGDNPTANDSEPTAMVKAHAYLTQTAGFVTAWTAAENTAALNGYVGTTNDPAGAGTQVAMSSSAGNARPYISFFVGSGKYFEVTHSTAAATITWTPLISGGAAPVDQD